MLEDVMTFSVFMGDDVNVFTEVERIKQSLIDDGLNVVREKIETVPWHKKAPSKEFDNYMMPPNSYFETHLGVSIGDEKEEKLLHDFCKNNDLHLSKNYFKQSDNGHVIMATYRSYDMYREQFIQKSEAFKSALNDLQLNVDKLIVEFAIYDTNVSHDNDWLIG